MNDAASVEPVGEYTICGDRDLSTENRTYYASSYRGIDRLIAIDEWSSGRPGIDWEVINSAVQERLSHLTECVTQVFPKIVSKSGSHRARHIALSSFKIYEHLDGDDHDPVYAGLTIVEEDGAVRISGDISGEESGHIYFDQGCEFSANPDLESVLAAAVEVSTRISAQAEVVIQAIRTPDSNWK